MHKTKWFPDVEFKTGMSTPGRHGQQSSRDFSPTGQTRLSPGIPLPCWKHFLPGRMKNPMERGLQGLGLDGPDIKHARRICIYRVLRLRNQDGMLVFIDTSKFQMKNLKPLKWLIILEVSQAETVKSMTTGKNKTFPITQDRSVAWGS